MDEQAERRCSCGAHQPPGTRVAASDGILVYGAGGHAKTVIATIEAEGAYRIFGVLDDDESRRETVFYGYPVLGGREDLSRLREKGISRVAVAIGNNEHRAEIVGFLAENQFELVRAVHPSVTLLRGAQVGAGTVVLPQAFVGSDACVGECAIVSVAAVVAHDARVGDFAQLCPNVSLAGGAVVGDYSFLGMGACVLQNVRVGREVVVGANAVVTDDLPNGVTAVGVPARIVKGRQAFT